MAKGRKSRTFGVYTPRRSKGGKRNGMQKKAAMERGVESIQKRFKKGYGK